MPLIRAATNKDVKGGEYFGPSKNGMPDIVKSNKASHNLESAKELWEISEKLTGLHYLD
ncbi:MAG: hypothetical protein LUF02_02200 [Erysipelotrichaceae bacterium]|nr:hypothetical protein [Erysipelotrichaceae bacterium]